MFVIKLRAHRGPCDDLLSSSLLRPMRRHLPLFLLLTVCLAPAAIAANGDPHLPARGSTMQQVESTFGQPLRRHAPAGGDSPAHPPITRWDYRAFSVYFERQRVIDSVVPADPPRVHHRNQLRAPSAS
jgi:hypothetical protein